MPSGALLYSELCERGNGVIITVLAKTLVLELDYCQWVLSNTEERKKRELKNLLCLTIIDVLNIMSSE